MLIDEEMVKGDKEAKIVIWCLQSARAGATPAMQEVLFSTVHCQAVIVRATVRTFRRFSFCPDLILAGGIPEQTATHGSFCIFWLVLPPMVHSHNIPFHGLSGSIVQFQVLEPHFVLGITEGFDHIAFQPWVVASWADQQLGRVKGCRSLSLESCCKRRLYSRWMDGDHL